MKRSQIAFSLIALAFSAPAALAQTPLVDVGFAAITANPDPDLIIVRERAYGAAGVDLTPYGIGTGPVDFVQSIYLRLHKGGDPANATSFRARVVFPAGVEVIGVIAGGTALGGSSDDGILTQTDALFAIDPALADAYSAPRRGLEDDNVLCVMSNQVFVHLSVTDGVDDLRIIVDYGTAFLNDIRFRVESTDVTVPSVTPLAIGMRIGAPGGSVVGSGDAGEVRGLIGIPLTGVLAPTPGTGFVVHPISTVYLARDVDDQTHLDAFDVTLGFLVPSLLRTTTPTNGSTFALGPNGYLYPIGLGSGAGYFDVVSGAGVSQPLSANLPGGNMGVTGDGGNELLWIARDRANSDARIDRVRASDMSIQQTYTIPMATVADPMGIVDAQDGMLYVVGDDGELARFDPATGTIATVWMTGLGGYVDVDRDATGATLYLLRDAGATTEIDVWDVATGTGQRAFATFAELAPVAVAHGPNGRIHAVGNGSATEPKGLWILDSMTGAVISRNSCSNLRGTFFGLSRFLPQGLGENYCEPAVANSTGRSAIVRANGSGVAGGLLQLSAWAMPENRFGYFIVGQGTAELFPVPGSQGRICLFGSQIGRFNSPAQVQNTGLYGRFFVDIDTNSIPLSPPVAVMAGETWNFQAWFRDDNPNPTSNFTDATAVMFQ